MVYRHQYPTHEHEKAAETIVTYFKKMNFVEGVILFGSCARGRASSDSCIDIMVLVTPEVLSTQKQDMQTQWETLYENEAIFQELNQVGVFSHVDLEFIDGNFKLQPRGWTSGPDEFELEIGNTLVYSVPLWENGNYFKQLQQKWLPYYDEKLRKTRLEDVKRYFFNNLKHIPLFVDRGLHFQAFDRFYNAFREFLQALFIARRVYPIAYDKWIQEQIVEILNMPYLYDDILRLFEIDKFDSDALLYKTNKLESLYRENIRDFH